MTKNIAVEIYTLQKHNNAIVKILNQHAWNDGQCLNYSKDLKTGIQTHQTRRYDKQTIITFPDHHSMRPVMAVNTSTSPTWCMDKFMKNACPLGDVKMIH